MKLRAEWETQSAIQLTFPHADSDWAQDLASAETCFVQIIEAICRFQMAIVVCADVAHVSELLKNCPAERLRLIELPSNDTWARDHAGITIEHADGTFTLWDFVFNGWGLKFASDKDNLLTKRLFDTQIFAPNVRHQYAPMVLEGGSLESDGHGTLITTAACLLSKNRNPHWSKQKITAQLKMLFGLKRVLWLHHGYLAGDDTDAHIDTLARLCDAETIAYVHCEDPNDEHFAELQAMERELQRFKTSNGKPYKLVGLPMADACWGDEGERLPATYANFLILNGAVLVPTYGSPHKDEEALHIIGNCFPDRAVIGIDCRVLIRQHGSLHCVTMQFPAGVVNP